MRERLSGGFGRRDDVADLSQEFRVGQVLQNGLDLGVAWVIHVLEERGGILRRLWRGSDNPLLVDIRHKCGLPGRRRYRLSAHGGKAGMGCEPRGPRIAKAVRRTAFKS